MASIALNGCWKKIWPEAVCDFPGFSEQQEEIDFLVETLQQYKYEELDGRKWRL